MATSRRTSKTLVRGVVAAGLALPLVLPSSAFGASPATFKPQGVSVKRLTAAVRMTKDDPSPTRAFTGPTNMLVDPENPRVIVAASADLRTRTCYLLRSTDAGHTWHIPGPAVPALKSYPYCTTTASAGASQADIAFGRNGTLYYALGGYGNGEGANNGLNSVLLARSTDLGNTWSTVLVDNNRGATGTTAATDTGVNGLAVDTSGPQDVVYVGFMQEFNNAPKGSPLTAGAAVVAVSTDGGRTFAKPVNMNTFSHVTTMIKGTDTPLIMQSFFSGPFLSVHNGVLVAISGSTPAPGFTGSNTGSTALPLLEARSTDQGKTFTFSALGPPVYTGTGTQTGLGWTPLGGAQGTFVAAYAGATADAASSGAENVLIQRSTDLGMTWSDPVIVDNDDPSQLYTSFYPDLGVAPDGRVDVVWEDNYGQANYHFLVHYSYSTDGGVSWAPNVEVTDQPIDFGLGISFNSDIRQPPGVASANDYAAFGWTDTRLSNATTQLQDDFGTEAQFATLPATHSTTLPVIAAIFAGLAGAGIILLLVLMVRRRGGPKSAVPPNSTPEPEAA